MNFAEVLKTYLEVGVLGLSGCLIVFLTYLNFKKNNKDSDKKDKKIDKKDLKNEDRLDELLKLIEKQNQEYHEQQIKNTEALINGVVSGIINHVPTPEENKKITEVTENIDKLLQEMLVETGANRACLVQYHNGGRGINKQSFLKMSMTNEQVSLGVSPMIQSFKDIFRSTLAYFNKELEKSGICYIDDYETLKDVDISMYEFLSSRGVQAKYGLAIRNKDKTMNIGFICLEFMNKDKADVTKINKCFKDKQLIVETLLSL